MDEQWKPLIGCEGYEISTLGRIRGLTRTDTIGRRIRPRVLRNARIAGRYMRIRLRVGGQLVDKCVHIFVLETFVGPRPAGMHACHGDGNVRNNALSNLRWDTPSANQRDKIAHGTMARGERNGFAKLTESDVVAIWDSPKSAAMIATELGLCRATVEHVRNGKRWQWFTSSLGRQRPKVTVVNRKPKTHCPKGHEYSSDNVAMVRVNGKSVKTCRTCRREMDRIRYLRRKAANVVRTGAAI